MPAHRHALLLAAALAAATPAPGGERLVFLNGDSLGGSLEGSDNSGNLLWRVAPDLAPVAIPIRTLHKWERDSSPPAAADSTCNISLNLSNGDVLLGSLESLGEDAIALKGGAFGSLRIPRPMLGAININQGGYYLLSDPGKARDWFVDNKGSWNVKNGTLTAKTSGTLSRDLPPATRWRVDFEVRTESEDPGAGFGVFLFATNPRAPQRSTAYCVRFNGSFVNAMKSVYQEENRGLFGRMAEGQTEGIGEAVRLDQPISTQSVRITLLADARAGILGLEINGKPLHQWKDERGLGEKPGTAIGFSSQSGPLVLSRLTVSRWNAPPQDATAKNDAPSGKADSVLLANDDALAGKITRLGADSLVMNAEHFGEITIPAERVVRLQLAGAVQEQARRLRGDVSALLFSGARLTLRLDQLDSNHLTGFSENFGSASLSTSALREITFNLYQEKLPPPEVLATKGAEALLLEDF